MVDSPPMSRLIAPGRLLVFIVSLLAPGAALAAERWTIGLTTSGAPIEALVVDGAAPASPTVLLLGGLQGKDRSTDTVTREMAAFEALRQSGRRFRLLAIP